MPDVTFAWLPEVGYFCLLLALLTCLAVAVNGVRLFIFGQRRAATTLHHASKFVALLLTLAWALLTLAFVQDNYSLFYVAQHSNRGLSLFYKLAAAWGGHEGSLLFWSLCLALWQAAIAGRWRGANRQLRLLTQLFLALAQAGLVLFIATTSDPFLRQFPVPADGRDLNPMLQHPALLLHPPLLYLGYAGAGVCCALLLAGLLCQTPAQVLARRCHRSLALSWALLSAGIILGSWWAYSELGWGGWWFWDPVENAALLPWLTGAACLHALHIMRRSGHLVRTTALLAAVSVLLTLLGTLVVRSGVLQSVHAFALDEARALPLFALFIVLSTGMLLAFAVGARGYRARPTGSLPSLWLMGALGVFCASAAVVLVGTLFPMVWSLAGEGRISVGAPYFNRVMLPFGLLAVVLMLAGSRKKNLPMWLAHAGVLLCASGIVSAGGFKSEVSVALAPGENVMLDGYRFTLHEGEFMAAGNYTAQRLSVTVQRGDKVLAYVYPERRFYTVRNQRMYEPGIATDGWHDWYVLVAEKQAEHYAVRFMVQRGVRFIWGGGALMLAGALAGAWCRRCK